MLPEEPSWDGHPRVGEQKGAGGRPINSLRLPGVGMGFLCLSLDMGCLEQGQSPGCLPATEAPTGLRAEGQHPARQLGRVLCRRAFSWNLQVCFLDISSLDHLLYAFLVLFLLSYGWEKHTN